MLGIMAFAAEHPVLSHSEHRPVGEVERVAKEFDVVSEYQPAGDQPSAIAELADRINRGERDIVLMGATGTGKSATAAWLIEKVQRPTLVMAPNKTLAAQLANELRQLLPNNAVEYFVSYYDYYQPEAYIAQTDTYIEKDSSINEDVERLRHSATSSLLSRRDVVVVSSVSCIYGLGTPQSYLDRSVLLKVGDEVERDRFLRLLVDIQYARNDVAFCLRLLGSEPTEEPIEGSSDVLIHGNTKALSPAVGVLSGFGCAAEVLEPVELRERIREVGEENVRLYSAAPTMGSHDNQ